MTLPTVPTAATIREAMRPLRRSQLMRLATLSGVSFNTIQKIASGETADPRLDTVAAIVPHIAAAAADDVPAAAPVEATAADAAAGD